MKYVSIDLETTGLDARTCQVLEIGAVIADLNQCFNPQPCDIFHRYVRHPEYQGQPYALALNQDILYILAAGEHPDITWVCDVIPDLAEWLYLRGHFNHDVAITVAGKNFAGFDKPFLQRLPKFNDHVKLHHRSLEPGTLFLRPGDTEVPGTEECMRRAGIDGSVAHTAVEDAKMVCRLLRYGFLTNTDRH